MVDFTLSVELLDNPDYVASDEDVEETPLTLSEYDDPPLRGLVTLGDGRCFRYETSHPLGEMFFPAFEEDEEDASFWTEVKAADEVRP